MFEIFGYIYVMQKEALKNNIDTGLDVGQENISNNDPLSSPDFHTDVSEILGDIVDLIQTQGIMNDEQVKSVIDDYINEKKMRGEMDSEQDEDLAGEDLKDRVFSEWLRRREEFLYAPPEEKV